MKNLHKKENKFLLIMLSLLCISLFTMPVFAAEQSINVHPSHQEVDIGEEFTVTINVTDILDPGIFAYELRLYYDNTLMDATNAEIPDGHFFTPETTPGIFIVDPGTINQDEGFVSFALTCMAPEPAKNGSGTLAVVTFNGTAVGHSTLELRDVIFAGPGGVEIPPEEYLVNDGNVLVIPEFPTSLALALFMTMTLVAIIIRKTRRSRQHYAPHTGK